MTTSPIPPLAVWDCNDQDGLFWQHWPETTRWATEHFPEQARRVIRAEFYVVDAPFAVLYMVAEDEHGHAYIDEVTGAVMLPPVTLPLTELPPQHLLGAAD